MRQTLLVAAFTLALAVAGSAWGESQTATEIKKDLFPKYKKAQAEGKDLGEAGKEYEAGDKALKDGMQEEALDHFKRAKSSWPSDGQ